MSPRTKILLGIGIAALAFSARIVPGPRTIDDAYITFRYARNLLEGEGPVFNPGQRVLGTTTPLYMGLLAAAAAPLGGAGAPFPEIALMINALADALTCLLLIRIGCLLRSSAAGWTAALLWALSPMSVTFAIGGLETSVYILLLVSVLYFRLEGNIHAMSALAGLAFLARPDALIFAGLIWLDLAVVRIREAPFRIGLKALLRAAIPFLLIVCGWLAFAALYYGTLLPHSILAKSVAYRLDPGSGFIRMLQHYGTPFFEHNTFGTVILLLTIPLYLFLSLVGIRAAGIRRPGSGASAGLVYPWLYFAVFSAANPLIFRWYLAPPLPFFFLSIFLGLDAMLGLPRPTGSGAVPQETAARGEWTGRVSLPKGRKILPAGLRRGLFCALAAAAMIFSLREWTFAPETGPAQPAPAMAFVGLEQLYRQVAEDLREMIPPGSTVAAGDVGVLGYHLDAVILDTVGLNSPSALRYYPLPVSMYSIVYAMPPDLILDLRPEVVVLLEVYGRNGLLKDSRFLDAYLLCGDYPTDIYGSSAMLVYCRKDPP
ncbi:MAG: hypothetical protein JW929_09630 [Anaerolineales bacterium]|nr:hypothetical protein [Anaerolineales bacterium]